MLAGVVLGEWCLWTKQKDHRGLRRIEVLIFYGFIFHISINKLTYIDNLKKVVSQK